MDMVRAQAYPKRILKHLKNCWGIVKSVNRERYTTTKSIYSFQRRGLIMLCLYSGRGSFVCDLLFDSWTSTLQVYPVSRLTSCRGNHLIKETLHFDFYLNNIYTCDLLIDLFNGCSLIQQKK